MIAKSDLVIMVLSASALAIGIYRWQAGASPAPVLTAATSVSVTAPAAIGDADVTSVPAASVVQPAATARPVVRRIGSTDEAQAPGAVGTAGVRVIPTPEPIVAARSEPAPADIGEPLYGEYRVRSGDYLGRIAKRFGTSIETLRQINDIQGSTIQIGQRIRYPQAAN